MNRLFYFSACLALAGLTSTVHADGIIVYKKNLTKVGATYQDQSTTVVSAPNLLTDILKNRLAANRVAIEKRVTDELQKPNRLGQGFTLQNITFFLGQPSLRILSANAFEITLSDNYLYGSSTQPTKAGSYANPSLEVHFNARLVCQLQLPNSKDPRFKVTGSELSITWLKATPRNVIGGLVTTGVAVYDKFNKIATGKSFLQACLQNHLKVDLSDTFNAWLGTVNGPLVKAHSEGYSNIDAVLDPAARVLNVTLREPNRLALRPVGKKK